MPHSLLLVPVPELEAPVRAGLLRDAPRYVARDPLEVHAHVTLLGPFVDLAETSERLYEDLAALFAAVRPFDVTYAEVRTFPDGTTYVAPEPEEPFRALTEALVARYPDHPPYGGAYDDVVPHLTIGSAADVAGVLPVTARAAEARLYWSAPDAARTLARFPFAVG
jgi:2'-5' RNA ligase